MTTTTITVINGNVAVKFSNPNICISCVEIEDGWFVYNRYIQLTAANIACEWADVNMPTELSKYTFKKAGNLLGCSCASLSRQLAGAMYRVWIKPIEKEALGMASSHRKNGKLIWDSVMLKDLRDAQPDMDAYPANMKMFALLKSRPRLEAEVGPERWSKLAKNSFYRNCCICKRMLAWVARTPKQFYLYGRMEAWDFVLRTPSTIIGSGTKISDNFFCDCIIKYIAEGIDVFKNFRAKHPKVAMKNWNEDMFYEEGRMGVPF